MVLYDENRNQKFYDINDLSKIVGLVTYIQYAQGFIHCFGLENNPSKANSQLAQDHAELAIKYIKKYKEIIPEKLKESTNLERLEAICKRILKKG